MNRRPTGLVPSFVLTLILLPAGAAQALGDAKGGSICGDNVLQEGEQCDDGNAVNGDGCSFTCQIETDFSCTLPVPGMPPTPSMCFEDVDGDFVSDDLDNCRNVSNPDQTDTNGDAIGNVCDADISGAAGTEDCMINFLDLAQLRTVFLTTDADADLVGPDASGPDGAVNFLDLGRMKAQFLGPPGPGIAGAACN